MDRDKIVQVIIGQLAELTDRNSADFGEDTPLIGNKSAIKSRVVVELMLFLEEYAEDELGCRFDWTSDSVLSSSRSAIRTLGTLADHLFGLRKVPA